jgi:hypothetical protein
MVSVLEQTPRVQYLRESVCLSSGGLWALGPQSVVDMLRPGRLGLSLADQGGRNLALNEGFCTQSRTIWPRTNGTFCRRNLVQR